MRIALLNIQYYPNVEGGAEISTQKLAEELAKSNDVYVIADGEYTGEYKTVNNVKVIRMPARIKYHNKIERVLTRCYKIQCYKLLKYILSEIQPDVLHTNNLHEFSVIVWKVAYELKIPVVHTLRDYTLLQTVRRYEQLIHKFYSNTVSIATAPSHFTLEVFKRRGYFKKSMKCIAIPNAIDVNKEKFQSRLEYAYNKPDNSIIKFAFLGRYHKDKGVDWLISVFDMIKINAELHLFGKGELTKESINILSKNNKIFDHGFLKEDCLLKELENIDVIVAPSLWDEPFGRVILDGYKNACPVIITNRGGMPEVIDDKKTGIILNDETNQSLAEALIFMSQRKNIKNMLPFIKEKLKDYTVLEQAKSFTNMYKLAIENRNYKEVKKWLIRSL